MIKEELNMSDKMSSETGKGLKDSMNPKYNMRIELFDSNGNIKSVRNVHNTVTAAGKAGLIDQIIGTSTLAKPGWMELGTGSPAATLLGAYITDSRVALTSKTRDTNVVTMVGTWGAGVGTGAITEAGIFDVVTQNTANMWNSASFLVINKGISDSLKITWELTCN
jgi:hypothetical protein